MQDSIRIDANDYATALRQQISDLSHSLAMQCALTQNLLKERDQLASRLKEADVSSNLNGS